MSLCEKVFYSTTLPSFSPMSWFGNLALKSRNLLQCVHYDDVRECVHLMELTKFRLVESTRTLTLNIKVNLTLKDFRQSPRYVSGSV